MRGTKSKQASLPALRASKSKSSPLSTTKSAGCICHGLGAVFPLFRTCTFLLPGLVLRSVLGGERSLWCGDLGGIHRLLARLDDLRNEKILP